MWESAEKIINVPCADLHAIAVSLNILYIFQASVVEYWGCWLCNVIGPYSIICLTLYGQIKTAEQRTIIQQYTDWYFIHWPMMRGLLHMVQPTVPTASTASVPTLYYSMWHYNCLCTLMKGLTECRALPRMQLLMTQRLLCKMFRFSVCWLLIFCSLSNSQIRLHARQWCQLFQPTTPQRRSSSLKHDQLLTAASRHVSAL